MAITDPLVLPVDVVLVPVITLDARVREQFEHSEDDYAITRPRSRVPSRIIDAQAAALIQRFRTPQRIIDAIIDYSKEIGASPEQTLNDAYPLIQKLIASQLLLPAESELAQAITASFEAGDHVLDCEIVRCIQVLEDTELYQVRYQETHTAALKLLRPGSSDSVRRAFEREAIVLRHLDGRVNPALLNAGTWEDRSFLIIEWCPGKHIAAVADELRRDPLPANRQRLLHLCATMLDAYAHLHAQQVVHSDIHPRNVIVADDRTLKIIDYGLSRIITASSDVRKVRRGGVAFFFEPEFAQARLHDQPPPGSSMLGEQYSLAVMLYLLLTGQHYLDFSLERHEMMRQIAEEQPVPFSQRQALFGPEVEQVIRRALSKQPDERFPTVGVLADHLRQHGGEAAQQARLPTPALVSKQDAVLTTLLEQVLHSADLAGPLLTHGLPTTPSGSINFGAAGIAYALYRISCIQQNAQLLALADIWVMRALQMKDQSSAFYNDTLKLTPETIGTISPYHTASGLYCAQALISHARADFVTQQAAIEAFIEAAAAPCANLDLTLGRSGLLIAAALLLDAMPDNLLVKPEPVRDFGMATMRDIWAQIDTYAPIQSCRELPFLGIAHGWAGILYATLRWCQVAATPIPPQLETRLQQLALCAETHGQGMRWRRKISSRHRSARSGDYMTSWCNGSPGFVHLWTLADSMMPNAQYHSLAEKAAEDTWAATEPTADLCCGFAGHAYALLNLYKHTGAEVWLQRARACAHRAAVNIHTITLAANSLYKGAVGVAVLAADLTHPETATMPFFERE